MAKPRKCANCGSAIESFPHYCAVNWPARLTGLEDGRAGEATHAAEWPSGTYGHADYWLGFYNDAK